MIHYASNDTLLQRPWPISPIRKKFLVKLRGTALLAVTITAVSGIVNAEETSQQAEARASYQRFLQSSRATPSVVPLVMSAKMAGFADAVKKAPGLLATKSRLLKIQELSVPLSDPGSQPTYEQLIAEVAGPDKTSAVYAQVFYWNKVAMDATSTDHTPPPPNQGLRNVDQVGPVRTSRAMAMVHIAMFEALNAIHKKYESYHGIQSQIGQELGNLDLTTANTSELHAIAYAAHNTLKGLYPSQEGTLALELGRNVNHIPEIPGNGLGAFTPAEVGVRAGEAAAAAVFNDRNDDRSGMQDPEASIAEAPGNNNWHKDPLNADPNIALGANWLHVKPFVMQSASQFHGELKGPPKFDSEEFKIAFLDVLRKGVDPKAGPANPPNNTDRLPPPDVASSMRTSDEEFIGKFWAYDATPSLCAPPRLYNMIATSLANSEKRDAFADGLELSRFLAVLNVVMADAGIAAWEGKFTFLYPRPVTYIRTALPGVTPIPIAIPKWAPLGAPVTNAQPDRVNFTPPFPSYPSGHAVFGGAIFQVFRKVFNSDGEFTFLSDEHNGQNHDPGSATNRPKHPVTFPSFTKAEEENGRSRVYLGIHWQFDAVDGIKQGNAVADYVLANLYKPVNP